MARATDQREPSASLARASLPTWSVYQCTTFMWNIRISEYRICGYVDMWICGYLVCGIVIYKYTTIRPLSPIFHTIHKILHITLITKYKQITMYMNMSCVNNVNTHYIQILMCVNMSYLNMLC